MIKKMCLLFLVLFTTACMPVTYETYIYEENMAGLEAHYQQGNDINALAYWGTPLGYAARVNNLESAQFLIDKGADVNKGNPDGYESKSPMHAAAAHGSVDVAKLLLANGADLSIRNRDNLTPLQMAKTHEQPDMIQLLNSAAMQQNTWDKTQETNTIEAYKSFISAYPQSAFVNQAKARLTEVQKQQKAIDQQNVRLAALEASLPTDVRRDKYMVQLSGYLKQQDYQQALKVFPKLESLPIATDPSLKFFYGEALLKTGQPAAALKKLYQYITEQGSSATHYARALELINQAESQL